MNIEGDRAFVKARQDNLIKYSRVIDDYTTDDTQGEYFLFKLCVLVKRMIS